MNGQHHRVFVSDDMRRYLAKVRVVHEGGATQDVRATFPSHPRFKRDIYLQYQGTDLYRTVQCGKMPPSRVRLEY